MTDKKDEAYDEKWWAEAGARARELGGGFISNEQMEEQRRALQDDPVVKKYPDSDGCEMAQLTPDGDIEITESSRIEGMNSIGTNVYASDDKDFDYYWKRHHFDDPKGRIHAIMKRFDEKSSQWIELGDEWIGTAE